MLSDILRPAKPDAPRTGAPMAERPIPIGAAEPVRADASLAAPRFGEAALKVLLAQLPVGVVLADRDGRLVYENEVARQVLEDCFHSPASTPPPAWSRAASKPYEEIEWRLARTLLTGELVRGEEIDYVAADDTRRWLSVSASPVRNAAGAIEAGVLTFEDVTARKQVGALEPWIESLARL